MVQKQPEIKTVNELLKIDLDIPTYQRPYKWTTKNVSELLGDIEDAFKNYESNKKFRYRLGSVILYKNNEKFEIVDGQQRLLTLSLIKLALQKGTSPLIEKKEFKDKQSIQNIYMNYKHIEQQLNMNKTLKQNLCEIFDNKKEVLEFVVLYVNELSEAFQLFDSQNFRGKQLDPHDLLKAYHLREMKNSVSQFQQRELVKKWESFDTSKIADLFSKYLFPILNWSKKEKTKQFVARYIDNFKGITEDSNYNYALRTFNAMPYFQIDQPFIAGKDFFNMVEHYLKLVEEVQETIEPNKNLKINDEIKEDKYGLEDIIKLADTKGFNYAVELFYCALLFYYDRFNSLDDKAVKKLFVWAMMIRCDMESLGQDTINNYAIGGFDKERYTNHIAMFYKIACARKHTDIANMTIIFDDKKNNKNENNFKNLYQNLKDLLGANENEQPNK